MLSNGTDVLYDLNYFCFIEKRVKFVLIGVTRNRLVIECPRKTKNIFKFCWDNLLVVITRNVHNFNTTFSQFKVRHCTCGYSSLENKSLELRVRTWG